MDNLHAQLEAAQSQAAAMAGLLKEALCGLDGLCHPGYDANCEYRQTYTKIDAALAAWKGSN